MFTFPQSEGKQTGWFKFSIAFEMRNLSYKTAEIEYYKMALGSFGWFLTAPLVAHFELYSI